MKELSDYVNNLEGEFLFVGIPKQSYFNSDKYLNYFEDGLEWWGAASISIYDKELNRYIVIFASATD